MQRLLNILMEPLPGPTRIKPVQWLLFALLLLAAGSIRLYKLDAVPPGLWYDEALYSLDGLGFSQGNIRLFYDEHGHPREPLYVWSLGTAFKMFGAETLVARSVSAAWGIVTVGAFFFLARLMVGNNLALIAMACLAVIRWHVHFSRTIFRALLPSAFAVGTLYFLYRWVLFRKRRDAIISGVLMGLGFYTYISFRVMPVVVGGWLIWIAWRKLVPWKETLRALAMLYGAAFLVVVPLLLNYAMNPEHVTARTSEITLWKESRTVTTDDGQVITQTVTRPVGDVLAELLDNKIKIARMWTIEGDPMARHNVPGMPVFLWPDGILSILGTVWALFVSLMGGSMVRNPAGESGVERDSTPGKWSGYISSPLLVLWLFLFLSASLFSRGAPNILRAQGAVPAVVILLVIGLWVVVRFIKDHRLRWLVIILFTGYFSTTQLQSYFVTFAQHPSVKKDFLAEIFYEPAVGVKEIAKRHRWVAVPREFAETLTPEFVLNTADNIVPYDPEDTVADIHGARDPGDFAWLITSRSEQLAGSNSQAEQLAINSAHIEGRTFYITEPRGIDQPVLRHPWAVLFLPREEQ